MTFHDGRHGVDEKGERVAVLRGIEEYQNLLREIEELEVICAYDAAKAAKDESVPFDQAVREIEQERR